MLLRGGALAAVAGGALRAAASFAPFVLESDVGRESLYVVVDVCLAVGLLAFSSRRSGRLGRWGAAGLALALAGIATIRANRLVSAADLYSVGALGVACGVTVLSVSEWMVNKLRGWVPAAFMLSTLVGVMGSVIQGANALFVCSGVIFGIAFAGLGLETWTSASKAT